MRKQRDAFSRVRSLLLILLTGVAPGLLFGGCTTEAPATGCRTVLNCKSDSAPICDSGTLACRACTPGADDVACANRNSQTPLCGAAGRCIGCMSNRDCSDLRAPRCDDSRCTTCRLASDCTSSVCNADGSCAPPNDVIFVDNRGGACSGATHSGEMSDPYCSIQDAVNAAASAGKSIIAVNPSLQPYGAVSISTVGSAGLRLSSTNGAPGSVQIRASSIDALSVTASGGKVLISGFDIASTNGNGATCSGSADLTLTTSSIHHNANGIVASGCTITLDRLKVYKNDYNGISLTSDSKYTLTNLMIWSNYASGIVISSSTGMMRFLTLYANGSPPLSQAPGISCGAGNNSVENSIVWRNVSQTGFTQQVSGCTTVNVVTDDSMGANYGATVKTNIDFVDGTSNDPNTYDLSLKPDSNFNKECCIDKVPSAAGYPDHDFGGSLRPNKTLYDIGADEINP